MGHARRNVDHNAVPSGRTVVHFEFPDVPPRIRAWWLVVDSRDADVCDVDPGHEVALTVRSSLRGMVQVWRGDVGWAAALTAELKKRQRDDGSWANPVELVRENDPLVATANAVCALAKCR